MLCAPRPTRSSSGAVRLSTSHRLALQAMAELAGVVLIALGDWSERLEDGYIRMEPARGSFGNVDMAVFCQVGRPLPASLIVSSFLSPFFGLFVLQIHLVGGIAF
jgi:hypothetical protein